MQSGACSVCVVCSACTFCLSGRQISAGLAYRVAPSHVWPKKTGHMAPYRSTFSLKYNALASRLGPLKFGQTQECASLAGWHGLAARNYRWRGGHGVNEAAYEYECVEIRGINVALDAETESRPRMRRRRCFRLSVAETCKWCERGRQTSAPDGSFCPGALRLVAATTTFGRARRVVSPHVVQWLRSEKRKLNFVTL